MLTLHLFHTAPATPFTCLVAKRVGESETERVVWVRDFTFKPLNPDICENTLLPCTQQRARRHTNTNKHERMSKTRRITAESRQMSLCFSDETPSLCVCVLRAGWKRLCHCGSHSERRWQHAWSHKWKNVIHVSRIVFIAYSSLDNTHGQQKLKQHKRWHI